MRAINTIIVTTSLPTITGNIGSKRLYIWNANGFLFTSTIPEPLVGQVSNVFELEIRRSRHFPTDDLLVSENVRSWQLETILPCGRDRQRRRGYAESGGWIRRYQITQAVVVQGS